MDLLNIFEPTLILSSPKNKKDEAPPESSTKQPGKENGYVRLPEQQVNIGF